MYFVNENHHAVTENDTRLLHSVCIMLRTLCFIGGRKSTDNSNWSFIQMECHSIARAISLIFKELTLVDGILVGLDLVPGTSTVTVIHTDHSWLLTPDGAIIDPYPMGLISTTSALLIPTSNTKYSVHGGNLYHKNPRVQERFDVTQSWRNARSCLRTLRKYHHKEDMDEIIKSIL